MAKVKDFQWFFNVEGQKENVNLLATEHTQAAIITNLHADKLGQWSVYNQGFSRLTSQLESGADFQSLFSFTSSAGTDYLIGLVNGKIKDINPSTGVVTGDITTGVGTTTKMSAAALRGNAFIVASSIAPQKWSGTGTTSSASGWPVINGAESYNNPKIVSGWNNRMVFANFTNYNSHLVISDTLQPETFTIAGSGASDGAVVQVSTGDGQEITALKPLFLPQSNDELLVIGKRKSIWALTGYNKADQQIFRLNANHGVLNNNCMVTVGNDIIYLSDDNVYSLTTATDSGTLQPRALNSDAIRETLDSINLSNREVAWGAYLPWRREVWFAVPTGSSTVPDKILVYNVTEGREMWSVRDYHSSTCAVVLNSELYTGDTDGYINRWFTQSTYAGTGIAWKYQYPWINFKSHADLKRILEMHAWFQLRGDETITVKTEWRGGGNETTMSYSMPISVSGTGSIYGVAPPAGVWGTAIWGEGNVLRPLKIPVKGHGNQFRLTINSTTQDTGITFLGVSGKVELMNYNRKYI